MEPVNIVKKFVSENFLFGNGDEIALDTNLFDKGIIDSTGIIELISFIEETFKISIDDDELVMDNFSNLNNIKTFLLKKRVLKAG